ncbi:cellulase family glycosylhydrolase [Solwaraspora sp. WMMD406]|uniref:cellulase family glycosylhydrolase n=1 Tax=Solwaraspora sp. WMMD406 TaxID=3016095 RepID=UPI00241812D4|nr:cellulase family glycosylhydrolase [Solwaraspora sp. WMMD406]MDG4764073.1 cellulase family glycosylhydrolase [Solwaraspora sp. WMMD406]
MKKRLLVLGAALLTFAASFLLIVRPADAAVGLHISGTDIVEANGQPFIMRGVNHPHVWYTGETDSFADIKALGANTVRVVLGSGQRWGPSTDVADVISLCKQNRMICVLEVHDTTGYGEEGAAASLDQAVDYWISQKSALVGEENYVVINIGNEPIGNVNAGQWTAATVNAIQRMRDNGFDHLLMIDAPNWGQDWQNVMRADAQTVLDADSHGNTVLSIHMYSVYSSASSIVSYLDDFEANGWPLVIGEFGWRFNSGEVDHDTILAEAQARGMGYLGWSWSGNTDPILDMVLDFDPDQMTTWGERIFHGPNGIAATAVEASVFSGTPPTTAPPTTAPPTTAPPTTAPPTTAPPTTAPPTTAPPGDRTCTADYRVLGQWPGGFQGDVRVTAGSAAITSWTVTWTFANGQTVNQAWNATVTSSGSNVTARNVGYNGSLAAGASTTFGFLGSWNGGNSSPSLTCVAS